MNEGERTSLVVVEDDPLELRLYSGSGDGNLVEIGWDESSDTMTPLSYWENGGYFGHVADCNAYVVPFAQPGGFGPGGGPQWTTIRILASKTNETFEIVSPPDWP